MTRFYYWIGYNRNEDKYQIACVPCVNTDMEERFSLQILRDSDFSAKINLGERISIKLVSYPSSMGKSIAETNILRHMNTEYEDENIVIEKEIEITLPDKVSDMIESVVSENMLYYDTTYFNETCNYSSLKINDGSFSLTLTHINTSEGEYYYYSHPTIILDH